MKEGFINITFPNLLVCHDHYLKRDVQVRTIDRNNSDSGDFCREQLRFWKKHGFRWGYRNSELRNQFNEVRLAINMTFPFTDRDYTIKFRRLETDSTVSYLYNSIVTEDFPEDEKYVRLIDARGGWTLLKLGNEKTLVTYVWNGDMRGDFPNWAYRKSWIKQGNEIMLDLRDEIKKRNSK